MHKIPSVIKNSFYSALTFFMTILVLSVGYGALVGGLSTADKVNSGSGLTATSWNRIIDGVLDLDSRLSNLSFSGGRVGIGTANPGEKLEVNGNIKVSGGMIGTNFGQAFASTLPNDMSFPSGGSVFGSSTSPMPVGTYFYQLYGCNGQNNFPGGAVGSFIFTSGTGASTGTNYFDNTNVGGGSCGYFRNGFIQVTAPNSIVQFKINDSSPGGNIDTNPSANSFSVTIIRIF